MNEYEAALEQARAHQVRGDQALQSENFAEAAEAYQAALAIYETMQDVKVRVPLLISLGTIRHQTGQPHAGQDCYHRALILTNRQGWREFQECARKVLKELAALSYEISFDEIERLFESLIHRQWLIEDLTGTAEQAYQNSHPKTASSCLMYAHQLSQRIRLDWTSENTLHKIAHAAARIGHVEIARDTYGRLTQMTETRYTHYQALWAWGRFEYRVGDAKSGCALCELALLKGYPKPLERRFMEHEFARMLSGERTAEDISDEPQTRLRLMLAEAPNSADAFALLRRLASTFETLSFNQRMITALAPREMDAQRAQAALETLLIWSLVKQGGMGIRQNLYDVPANVRTLIEKEEFPFATPHHFQHFLFGDRATNEDVGWHLEISFQWPHIRAAIDWGEQHEPQLALDLLWALQAYKAERYSLKERMADLDRVYSLAQQLDNRLMQAHQSRTLGDLSLVEDSPRAYEMYLRALSLYDALGDVSGQMATLRSLAVVVQFDRHFDKARSYYERLLPLYSQQGLWNEYKEIQAILEEIAYCLAENARTAQILHDQCARAEELGNIDGQIIALMKLAVFEQEHDGLISAQKYLEKALALAQQHNHLWQTRDILRLLTPIAIKLNAVEDVRALFAQRLRLAEQMKHLPGAAIKTWEDHIDATWEQGRFECQHGDYQEGLRLCQLAFDRLVAETRVHREKKIETMRHELEAMRW